MFVQEIERAVMGAQRAALPELSLALWRAHAAGAIGDDDAQRIAELIQARKATSVAASNRCDGVTSQRRNCVSRPRSPASMDRRRRWAASSWLPPAMAARFTLAEQAALGVVLAEIALTGRCELCHGAVAGRAGVSVSTVKRAMAEARRLGLVLIEVRRVSRFRNDSNVVTVLSAELRTWVATRARGLRAARGMWDAGGGVHVGAAPKSISKLSLSSAARTAPDKAGRGAGGAGGGLPGPHQPAVLGKSTADRSAAPYSRFSGRRVQ